MSWLTLKSCGILNFGLSLLHNIEMAIEDTHVIILIGMAAAGKSATIKALQKMDPYTVNLDPAVLHLAYTANIDIRDTIDYDQLMKDYSLGPNGAIMTALNLFATKFHDVIELIKKRNPKYVVVDTPGQIEAFTWSASGQIIMETLASQFKVTIVYVVDSVKCNNPVSFMSNLVYACSIMYKSQLPFVLYLNKSDEMDTSKLLLWMSDYDEFMSHLNEYEDHGSYATDLAQSMALMLEDFYKVLVAACGSSLKGEVGSLIDKINESKKDFEKYKKMREEAEKTRQDRKRLDVELDFDKLGLDD
eukprot:NODE_19_length_47148_cov_1.447810.p19 type:complete len:303 gc:universal NODE_19_length_47148_cov_1.447810:22017-21109(-)